MGKATNTDFRTRFDQNILTVFRKGLQTGLRQPRLLPFLVKALNDQANAARLRRKQLPAGLEIPPLLIASLTRKCNLRCSGCYSQLLHTRTDEELKPERFRDILAEAEELGVSIVLLAGGEPLLRRDLLDVAASFPHMVFPVFTNGMLLDAEYLGFFRRHKHLIPVISLEGRELETDSRRGDGVYQNFQKLCPQLRRVGLFWGISLTLTRPGYELQLSEHFLREYLDCGCSLFFFVEYVPVAEGSDHLILSPEQKESVGTRMRELTNKLSGLYIAFPGDEEQYGGCLAAGRGFLHISPSGYAEPCPFAPFSDVNLQFSSLKDALASPLLSKIREEHHLLKESEGGCALWANREYISELKERVERTSQ
jgi:MoaA/NifB/PqqE/SkfB family radical SAM enzyme